MEDKYKKLLILIDGSGYLFRAFFALPPLTSPQGQPTGAILGVLNMLRRLIQDYPSAHFAAIFDAKGKTFRHDMYDSYKANRAKMPDDLGIQIEPLKQMIKSLGIPLISIQGVEADDVIGTCANYFKQKDFDILVSTGDKDLAQIVDNKITIVDTMKNKVLNPAGVKDKFGVEATQIIDYLALIGDTSDNIPGVPKVGPKTAVKWLDEYKNLDNIIQNADKFKGKVGEYLRENLSQLELSKELVKIKLDVDISKDIESYNLKDINVAEFKASCEQLGFSRWLSHINSYEQGDDFLKLMQKSASPNKALVKDAVEKLALDKAKTFFCIRNLQDWEKWFKKLKESKKVAIDTETTSLNVYEAKLVGVSFGWEDAAIYIPINHDEDVFKDNLQDKAQILADIKSILESENIKKIGQNLKYDLQVLRLNGINLKNIYFDTMLASFVLDSGKNKHNLDLLAEKHLFYKCVSFEEIAGKGVKQKTFNQIDVETAYLYAAEDAYITFKLYDVFENRFKKDDVAYALFSKQEMPLLEIIADMELYGVHLDCDKLAKQSEVITKELENLKEQVWSITQCEFNLDSTQQLGEVLYAKMGLPVLSKTPKGVPSTSESALSQLAQTYDIAKLLLKYRHYAKLKNTYLDKLPKLVNPETARLHASFHQTGTVTGRLSSSEPNLQNIPMKTKEGALIREAFVAEPGWKIISADYSQIELRIMAHLCDDPGLIKAFENKQDVHKLTAAEVFGIDVASVTDEQRRVAKAINFGLMYGMSAFGLAKQLGIGRSESQEYINSYFLKYPNVKDFIFNIRELAKDKGYVETVFGRKLYFPDIKTAPGARREGILRSAINAPLQGSAADLIKRAMVLLDKKIKAKNLKAKLILQVHDELVLEVPEDEVDVLTASLEGAMVEAAKLKVPLVVDVGVNASWAGAH